MAYTKYTYELPGSIEYEFRYKGLYGAKGEKRQKRNKATPEQIKRQNQKNRENKVRRIIKANFQESDYWTCLKYPKGMRKPPGEVKEDLKKYLARLRREYAKRDKDLKFIYRMEIGKQGGIHIHIILPRIRDGDKLLQECWPHGRVSFENLYEQGGYEALSVYLVKPPPEEQLDQMNLFEEEEQKTLIAYSSSRNLIRPEPKKEIYSRWTVRKIIEQGPKPSYGYWIDKNTIVQGVNQYTGMSYLYYTEVRGKQNEELEHIHHDG